MGGGRVKLNKMVLLKFERVKVLLVCDKDNSPTGNFTYATKRQCTIKR